MNQWIEKLIIKLIFKKETQAVSDFSSFKLAKGFQQLKLVFIRSLKDFFLVSLGVFSASIGLKCFLLPNKFIDGGVTGISLLLTQITSISLSWIILIINIPFIFIGLKLINKPFAYKTALAIVALAIFVSVFHFPIITTDKLLVAIFGGFFLGTGIGLSVRGGAVIDGTEILSIYLSKRFHITIGDLILLFNVVIFSFAAYLLSVETALYSILTYLAASKTVDFIVEGIEEYIGVTIVSNKSAEIRVMITEKMQKGVTIYKGRRGFGKTGESLHERDILYTVITRLEMSRLSTEIEKIDANAFVVSERVKDTKGGIIKKRPLKHFRR